ncbi:hypothetical protein RF11_03438 [Thelohanellus kitauei]|uniref:Uncharacterized protein n=1 Tax=Thelohanellus kitauei TaxID=669202 RepID=A0A0C2MHJ8_THEKT|nr:hypothetical protein RF11_03438 [Thelohanellus kitauei]
MKMVCICSVPRVSLIFVRNSLNMEELSPRPTISSQCVIFWHYSTKVFRSDLTVSPFRSLVPGLVIFHDKCIFLSHLQAVVSFTVMPSFSTISKVVIVQLSLKSCIVFLSISGVNLVTILPP